MRTSLKSNVIIADDSPEFIEGLKVLFSLSKEYQIIDILKNGEELINSAKLREADILLIDIEMPRMNGLDAARQINYRNPLKPMIAMTMFLDKIFLKEIIEVGFKGFIHKPNVTNNLFNVMDKVMNNQYVFPDTL